MVSTTPLRQVRTEFHAGKFKAKSILSPEGFPVRALIKVYPRRVIPVIFLPGVMGTNLRLKRDGAAAWRPPNGKWEGVVQLISYLGKDANARKKTLHPDLVEVDEDGPLKLTSDVETQLMGEGKGDSEKYAQLHGWGELHQESYAFILNTLHHNLHNILNESGDPSPYWQRFVLKAQGGKEFGAEKDFVPVAPTELKKFSRAAYPVHAIGYNWLQSNLDSATRVAERVEAIINFYSKTLGKDCDKVLLVTHSMGGLVARAYTELKASNRVLGVVHGVMPAIGAPATYKRMRAGFEGVAKVLLGRNGAETTAVLAQSPGPLQLLPSGEYAARVNGEKRHWLRANFLSPLNPKFNTETMLGAGDPYDKIYLNQTNWWRLAFDSLLHPAATKGRSQIRGQNPELRSFRRNIETVRKFQGQIAGKYHGNCHAFYAADIERPTWGEVRWCASGRHGDLSEAELVSDNLSGLVLVRSNPGGITSLSIDGPDTPGDGTVPELSGQAPSPFIKQIFRHEGQRTNHPSYEHQFAYGQDFIAGLTLYSIVRLTLDSGVLDGR